MGSGWARGTELWRQTKNLLITTPHLNRTSLKVTWHHSLPQLPCEGGTCNSLWFWDPGWCYSCGNGSLVQAGNQAGTKTLSSDHSTCQHVTRSYLKSFWNEVGYKLKKCTCLSPISLKKYVCVFLTYFFPLNQIFYLRAVTKSSKYFQWLSRMNV